MERKEKVVTSLTTDKYQAVFKILFHIYILFVMSPRSVQTTTRRRRAGRFAHR